MLDDTLCVICLELLKSQPHTKLPCCAHRFHDTCLQEYEKNLFTTCPICRLEILAKKNKVLSRNLITSMRFQLGFIQDLQVPRTFNGGVVDNDSEWCP